VVVNMKSTVLFFIFAFCFYLTNANILNKEKNEETSDPLTHLLSLAKPPTIPGIKLPGSHDNSGILNIPGIGYGKEPVDADVPNSPVSLPAPVKRVPVPEMIKAEGYPIENHYVTTSDGYILNLHRIPHGKDPNKKKKDTPVYLQHGLLCSSADWIVLGPQRSLAYMLADEGYDVWLGNVRGNTYSRNHTTLNPDKDSAFWAFSWNEIGIVDVPTITDYILKATGKSQVFHIGHSQGTTSFYIMASERPEYNKKIKAHISLAPVAYMKHLISPELRFVAFAQTVAGNHITSLIGDREYSPVNSFKNLLHAAICNTKIGSVYCQITMFKMAGFSPDQMRAEDTAIIYAHYPAGSAVRQVSHYAQEVTSGHFRKYDFGKLKNIILYNGALEPPDYPLSKITAPIHLFYSSNDWLANEKDVLRLSQEISSIREKYWVPIPTWNHVDHLFGRDAPRLIYKKAIDVLSKYEE